jgi:heme iron utilization protein
MRHNTGAGISKPQGLSLKKPADFDPKSATKKLLREARSGALATLMPGSGDPFCSLVNVASAADGSPLLLLSRLAVHTRNLLADPRISVMLDERKAGDPLEGARVTLTGTAMASEDAGDRRRYLARQPEAEAFAGFADFGLYRLALQSAHLVAGFGRIVDLAPVDVLVAIDAAAALIDAEAEIVEHLNADHADTLQGYATKLLGAPEGAWRCAGCDPEGLELQLGRYALRLPFRRRVVTPGALRQMLKELAADARAA